MLLLSLLLVAGMVASATSALAAKPTSFDNDGKAVGLVGNAGFDTWGYNYNAHMFSGGYCDSYRDAPWCEPYKDINLIMKWNDAWLSRVDLDDDAKDPYLLDPPDAADLGLDRHYGFDTYLGSGAWLTNHQAGEYTDAEENVCKWTYFTKIVAVPTDATATGGIWYTADATEIGPVIWGSFAVIQEVSNDKCAGIHGAQYVSPFSAGFGAYGPTD